jgi:hypothetical protein
MRTSVDLPDGLMRRAKTAALEEGVTFRELCIRALKREVSGDELPKKSKRLTRPVFKSTARRSSKLPLTAAGEFEEAEDRRQDGLLR